MEIFDKITKKATQTYKGAAEKTGKLAKEAKLRIKINDNKSKINELYQEIGKKVYQKHTSNEDVFIKKDLEEECAKIDILSSEIDTYHKEILQLSNVKVCINCKEPMDKNANFCPKCGTEQPEEQVTAEESEIIEAEVIPQDNEESNEAFKESNEVDTENIVTSNQENNEADTNNVVTNSEENREDN